MLSHFLPIFFTMFIVIDPIGLVPVYLSLTSQIDKEQKNKIILKAVFTAFLVLTLFIVAGKGILGLLHIHPGAFFIAGGIMLFVVSLDMLFGKPTRTKVSRQDMHSEEESDDGV